MRLHTRSWGRADADPVVCVHGVCQHGGIFEPLGRRMAELDRRLVAVDLRGHGRSLREPPWDVATHVQDLIDTVDALGLGAPTWVGHSFGGHVVAAVAARAPERVRDLVLIDPGLHVDAGHALRRAEIDRLDWSFASVDSAVAALLSGDDVVATSTATATAYAREDLRRGADGRLRFSFCPSAVVVAWSEMASPAPPIADARTLLIHSETAVRKGVAHEDAYRQALGPHLTVVTIPNGHNVMWEAPVQSVAAIERFLAADTAPAPAT